MKTWRTWTDDDEGRSNALTPRERDIIRLVAFGLLDKEIAVRYRMSPRSVSNNCRRIYRKLGVRNRVEAARWAWQQGIGTGEA